MSIYNDTGIYDDTLRWNDGGFGVASLLTKPGLKKIFLAEITAGLECAGWVLTSGKAITYQISTTLNIISVKADSFSLTLQSSVANVESNPGSYYFASGILYVSMPTGTPFSKTVMATVQFYFSTVPKIFNNTPYLPRLKSIPSISVRIEERFSGVGQVSGGDIQLINNDGYFDDIKSLQWNYGAVIIKMGLDFIQGITFQEQLYSEYQTIGTWIVENSFASDTEFKLYLKDTKSRLQKKIPLEIYSLDNYPSLLKNDIGKPIQRVYGLCLGCKPILIDPGTNRFKVAGHAIYSFAGVRIKTNDLWADSSFATVNTLLGEFTLGSDWESGREVSVDLIGMTNADGSPMLNASDIVSDLLTYIGETNQNTASFTESHNRLDLGLNIDNQRTTVRKPSIYLDTTTDILELFGKINDLVGSYLIPDNNGQWSYTVWRPSPSEGMQEFNRTHSLTLEEETDVTKVFSAVSVTHSKRKQDDYAELVSLSRTGNQYANGLKSSVLEEREIPCADQADANTYAERILVNEGVPMRRIRNTVPHTGFLLSAGSQIHVTDSRAGIDEVLEVIQFNADLTGSQTKLITTRLREFGRHCGFVVAAADVLPTRFASETGYGAGSLTWNDAWSDTIKTWVSQNVVYSTDANGFAKTTDAESVTSHCI